jgi:hypothetical protein
MDGTRIMHGRDEKVYTFPIGKPEEKKSLGKPGRRWEDNINIAFKKRVEACRLDSYRL